MGILRRSKETILSILSKDSIFYSLYIFESLILIWFNWNNDVMEGILPYYRDFANFFMSGFDVNTSFESGSYTFPMWGYGLFMIKENKLLIILIQIAFMLYVTYRWDVFIQKYNGDSRLFRIFVLLGICYILFHTPLWPYSISASLLNLALLQIIEGHFEKKFNKLLFAAVFIGIALNFRSDFLYYSFGLSGILLILSIVQKINFSILQILTFLGIIIFLLVPWMLYTKAKTGHVLMNSTNGGHVMWIGLGMKPGNVFNIIPDDSDPRMKNMVLKSLDNDNTVTYDADTLLKKAWITEVKKYPKAFFEKCLYIVYLTVSRPFTLGHLELKFSTADEISKTKQKIKKDIGNMDIGRLLKNFLNGKYFSFFIPFLINILNILIFFVFIFLIINYIIKSGFGLVNDVCFILMFSIISYQLILQTVLYYMPNYHTNVYLIYAVVSQFKILNKRGPILIPKVV